MFLVVRNRNGFVLCFSCLLLGILPIGCQELNPDQVQLAIVKDIQQLGGRVAFSYAIGDFYFDTIDAQDLSEPVGISCDSEEVLNIVIDRHDELPKLTKLQLNNCDVSVSLLESLTDAVKFKTMRFDKCAFDESFRRDDESRFLDVGSVHLTRMHNDDVICALTAFHRQKLKIVNFDGCSLLPEISQEISDFKSLVFLSLRLSDSASEIVSEIQSNTIEAIDVSDSIIEPSTFQLEKLPNLKYINFRRTSLSADQITKIVRGRSLDSVFVDDEHRELLSKQLGNVNIYCNDMFVFKLVDAKKLQLEK